MKAKEFANTFSFECELCPDAVWFSARQFPINLYGLYDPEKSEHFMRIPPDVAEKTSDGVRELNLNTSGGRFTFSTDSPYIALHAVMPAYYVMPHMPRSGNAGFDVYLDDGTIQTFCNALLPPARPNNEYFSCKDSHTNTGSVKNYVANFPLYDKVDDVYIGVSPDAEFGPFTGAYTNDAPIVFYGSSITQGGCVSRPGLAYPSYISRRFRRDFINLGFSGNGKAEDVIVDYMAGLDMSVFVCDYDHNAPNEEYLEKTHFHMYEKIRAKNPSLPYVMVSMPDTDRAPESAQKRRDIIFASYKRASESGDENVYFIDGHTLFGTDHRDSCTVDTTHPNDLGHFRMGCVIGDFLENIINAK